MEDVIKMVIVCIQQIVLIVLVKMDMKEMVLIVLVQSLSFLFFRFFINSIKATKYESLIFNFNLIDIDECLTNNGRCDVNAKCENTIGSRNCTCKTGYSANGTTCLGRIHFLFSPCNNKTL